MFGVRPAVWTGYVTGGLLLFPLFVLIFVPYITGDWSSSNLHNLIDFGNFRRPDHGLGRLARLQRRLAARDHVALPDVLVVLRVRVLRLVRAGVPRSGARHRQGAARGGGVRRSSSTRLLPIGALGTFGDQNITLDNTLTFYGDTFEILLGSTAADILVVMLCAGIVLSMNTATMDGSRALYGISQDGMTIQWLGQAERATTCRATR